MKCYGKNKELAQWNVTVSWFFDFRDAMIFAGVNSFTSILAGLVIFSVLGFMAKQQGVSVADVAESGRYNSMSYANRPQ